MKTSKFTKEQVAFEHPAKGMDKCGNCVHYIRASQTCRIVRGQIMPEDWCKKFEAKR